MFRIAGAYKQEKSVHFIFLFEHTKNVHRTIEENVLSLSAENLESSVNISWTKI